MKRATAAASSHTILPDETTSFTTPSTKSSPYSTPDLASNKRQKLDTSASSTPISAGQTPTPSENGLSKTVDEAARQRALYLRDCGETEWVIDLPPGSIPHTSARINATQEDGEEGEIWSNTPSGRQTYGNFRRKHTVIATSADGVTSTSTTASSKRSESDSSSDSADDGGSSSGEMSGSPPPAKSKAQSLTRSQNKKTRRFESDDNRLDRLNLTRLSSLSGGGGGMGFPRHTDSKPKSTYKARDVRRTKYEKSFADSKDRKGFKEKIARRKTQ